MENESLRIKCPHCGAVLLVKKMPGLETKNIPCPICKNVHKFTEYQVPRQPASTAGDDPTLPSGDTKGSDHTQPVGDRAWGIGRLRQKGYPGDYKLSLGMNTLGRAAQTSHATVQIKNDDGYMSRMHGAIEVTKLPSGGYVHYYFNTENKNPTYINGVKVEKGDRIILSNGDVVKMANTELTFVVETGDETQC